jgi:hypothetical protein
MNRLSIRRAVLAGAGMAVMLTIGMSAYSTFGKWAVNPVVFYVNPANADVSSAAAEAALNAGMEIWNTQGGSPFRYSYGGRVNDTSVGYDNRNVILFRDTQNPNNSSAIASTYCWASGGSLVDCDIIFWDGHKLTFFTGSDGCSGGAYIEDIAAHELGHALGLSHSDVRAATMYPSYSTCSQELRTLEDDDIAGVQSLYGSSGAAKNTAPTVSISSPSDGASFVEGTDITFAGTATDKEDGKLTAYLTWTSSLDGWIGSGGSFARTLSVGTHAITAAVTDSGGLSHSSQVTITVAQVVSNTAPTVSISSPGNDASFAEGTAVTFSGSASDFEDGDLTPKLMWTSSVDGALGTGTGFSRILSAGLHVVAATVTDSGGVSAVQQVTVTVSASTTAASSGAQLTAHGYKLRGQQMADLSWSGLSATRVDVYRNGGRVATVTNTGAHTDSVTGRGTGAATYQVCEAGSTTCTNTADVRF